MKRKESYINYWELLSCVIILAATFQVVCYFVFNESFIDDSYGMIRLVIVLLFISLHYKTILFSQFFKSFKYVLGLFVGYLIVVFIFLHGFKIVNSEMVNSYIDRRVEKIVENSRSEMASKGFALNEGNSREVIKKSVQINQSVEKSVVFLLYKLLATVIISILIAWLVKKERFDDKAFSTEYLLK